MDQYYMNLYYYVPYIPEKSSGAPVRDYYLLKYLLNKKKVNIDLIYLHDGFERNINLAYPNLTLFNYKKETLNAITYAVTLLRNGLPPSYLNCYNDKILYDLKRTSEKKYDVAYFSTLYGCHTYKQIYKFLTADKKILNLHNVNFQNFKDNTNTYDNVLIKYVRKKLFNNIFEYELNCIKLFDELIVVSDLDREVFIQEGLDENRIHVVPNGVDINYFKSYNVLDNFVSLKHPNVFFMGKLSYKPNIDALLYYIQEIHPKIKNSIKNVVLYVIGKNPPHWLTKISDDSIKYLGFVDDVRPYIYESDVCIAPLRYGSGTRLKILEYIGCGKPVVSTVKGAEGLNLVDKKHILLSDDTIGFAEAVISLLSDFDLSQDIAKNGNEFVAKYYDWSLISDKLFNIFKGIYND